MEPPKTVQELAKFFKKLPSIGSRTSQRLAYACLALPKQDIQAFISALTATVNTVHPCSQCGLLIDTDKCPICDDVKRKSNALMVVTSSRDVLAIESSGSYQGKYFVLKGTISPADHRTPESIGIDRLVSRIEQDETSEVIVCTGNDLEGETTAMYIAHVLKNKKVRVTEPASGLPSGAILEYADPQTIAKAISGRVEVESKES